MMNKIFSCVGRDNGETDRLSLSAIENDHTKISVLKANGVYTQDLGQKQWTLHKGTVDYHTKDLHTRRFHASVMS